MLSRIRLSGYRGMSDRHIDLSERCVIVGANGSGKTHILEAIHLASGGSLHYFHAPRDDSYTLELTDMGEIGPKSYSVMRHMGREEYRIQSAKVSGVKYRESLPYRSVMLSPFDMNLLYFAPSVRRDYIDSVLARSYAQFPRVRRDYETVMRQRNALLKKIRDGEARREDLEYWDETFASKASLYMTYRDRWIDFVGGSTEFVRGFLPKYEIEFSYESRLAGVDDRESYIREYLRENRERDILTGHTHIGPHLDDFGFQVGGMRYEVGTSGDEKIGNSGSGEDTNGTTEQIPHVSEGSEWNAAGRGLGTLNSELGTDATMILSRGETKMLLLALKQIEIVFLRKVLDLPIILLFDDLFAELDLVHALRVIEMFESDQVIITTQRPLPKGEGWDHFSCIMLDLP